MNLKTATISQLKEKIEEITKEYEKNKRKLSSAYTKMNELAQEYITIKEIIEEKSNG